MLADALRKYVQVATGLKEVSRKRAEEVAQALQKAGALRSGQVQKFTEDLVNWSRENREAVLRLVKQEIARQLKGLGMATKDEVRELAERVAALEKAAAGAERSGPARSRKAAREGEE